jgi:inosose dehydratase
MKDKLSRRDFAKTMALGATAAALPLSLADSLGAAPRTRNVKIGHTGITWPMDQVDQAIKDVASLGYWGFETFGFSLEQWEAKGGLGPVLEQNHLPLISGYITFPLTDAAKRKESMPQLMNQVKLVKKLGGKVIVLGPNQVDRAHYNFAEHKAEIVQASNEVGKMISDQGLTAAFHQHTGTCVESRDETYATMEAVDHKYVRFGPDIGQLRKGGQDPVQVVKDFLSIVEHMHLKDWNGGQYYLEYCPLGQGKVNVPAILDMMDGRKIKGMVMVELDGQHFSPNKLPAPETPKETAAEAKSYLEKQGVKFRTT